MSRDKKISIIGKFLNGARSKSSRDGSDHADSLSPKRVAEITHRISENFYDREDILQIVAERILHSSELQEFIRKNQSRI